MAFAYAIFSLKEAVSLDDVYQHIGAIPELYIRPVKMEQPHG